MKTTVQNLAIAAIIVGIYGLTSLPFSGLVSSIGAIIIGILLLTR